MKLISGFIMKFTDGYGDGILTLVGAGVVYQVNDMINNSVTWANIFVSWGMVFIVGYGVVRIALNLLWNILFGRNFHWKVGLLDRLFRKLKPVRAQEIAEATDEEIQEKALQYIRKFKRVRKLKKHGGVKKMSIKNVIQQVNANKWTILGVGSIVATGAMAATGVVSADTLDQVVGLVNGMPIEQASEGLISATAMGATAFLGIKAALGKGIETTDEYKARKEQEAQLKAEEAELKASGKLAAQKAVNKLVVKLHIPEVQAKEIVAVQLKAKQDLEDLKAKQAHDRKVQKLAAKLHISPEQAEKVIKEQELAMAKLDEAKAAIKAVK